MNYQQLLEALKRDLPQQMERVEPGFFSSLPWGWITVFLLAFVLIGFLFWFFPVYGVWASRKHGEAQLAEAEYAEQVAIAEARARFNAAEMNKKAEVVEAEAVSISINTIGDALKQNEGYLRWQWIKMMDKTNPKAIYVPTEGSLPVLEASRLNTK